MADKSYRIIFHIDLNCFFAACHIKEDPSLKGKPIVVCHDEPLKRSIVLTASYEARRYGVYTPMLLKDALPLCPSLTVVQPRYQLYEDNSKKFFNYLRSITYKVEPASIDEAFIDMTDVCGADAYDYAKKMQDYIYNVLGLPCSIGIAPNKFLAKMASDMKKPLGITVLRKRDVKEKVWPLPIKDLLGVGKKSQAKMEELGIKTIGDLDSFNDKGLLLKTFGPAACEYFREKLEGNDSSLVVWEEGENSSLSNESTFEISQTTVRIIKQTLKELTETVSNRLVRMNKQALTVGIKIKYETLYSFTRSRGLTKAINSFDEMYNIVEELFDDNYDGETGVRLVGVTANRLVDPATESKKYTIFDNFDEIEQEQKVKNVLKEINNIYGEDTIKIGVHNGKK